MDAVVDACLGPVSGHNKRRQEVTPAPLIQIVVVEPSRNGCSNDGKPTEIALKQAVAPKEGFGGAGALLPETQSSEELLVALFVLSLDVFQKLPALRDEAEEAATGSVVFLVVTEVASQMRNSLRQAGDLNVSTAGVSVVELDLFEIDVFGGHGVFAASLSPQVFSIRS